jgi:hypothetical protein
MKEQMSKVNQQERPLGAKKSSLPQCESVTTRFLPARRLAHFPKLQQQKQKMRATASSGFPMMSPQALKVPEASHGMGVETVLAYQTSSQFYPHAKIKVKEK